MRPRHAVPIAAAILALAGPPLATPAAAQGQTFSGTLQPCPGGHRVRLESGRRYSISASSDEFDTVLRVLRSGSDAVLAENDDGGEGTNSRLSFTPSETGDHLVCVTAFAGTGSGRYSVAVTPAAALRPPATAATRTETATRRVYEGSLARGDDEEDGAWFDDYLIRLEPGQHAIVSLRSDDFDTLLKVYRADQRGGELFASDDDGGGELNSLLVLAPEEGGEFIVRATSFSGGSTGAYRLTISD